MPDTAVHKIVTIDSQNICITNSTTSGCPDTAGDRGCADIYKHNSIKQNDKISEIYCFMCGSESFDRNLGLMCRYGCQAEMYVCSELCRHLALELDLKYNLIKFYKCTYCNKNVKNNCKSIFGEECKSLCHKKCLRDVSNEEFSTLINSKIKWSCFKCNIGIFPLLQLNDHDFNFECLSLNNELGAARCYDTCRCTADKQCIRCVVKNIQNFSLDMLESKNEGLEFFDDIDPFKNLPCHVESKYITINQTDNTKSSNNFSLLNLNIRSIRKNFKTLEQLLAQSNKEYDIITISETWLDNFCDIDDYRLEGYSAPLFQNRTIRRGGGVMIYFRECVESFREVRECSYVDKYNNILTIEYVIGGKKTVYYYLL